MNLRTSYAVLVIVCSGVSVSLSAADSSQPEFKPKFASALNAEVYPPARAPELVRPFKWKFATKADYRYKFEQISENRTHGLSSDPESLSKSTASGDLVVRSLGDGTGRIILENVKVKLSLSPPDPANDVAQSVPTTVLAGLRDDGTLDSASAGQQALVKLLFPIPSKLLGINDVAEVPIEIQFNAMGSLIPVKGVSRMTNAGSVMLGKRLCVELRIDTTFAPLNVPEELPGKYDFSMAARSVFFYDPSESRFVRGVIAISTSFAVDTQSPTANSEYSKQNGASGRIQMSIASDDLITLEAE